MVTITKSKVTNKDKVYFRYNLQLPKDLCDRLEIKGGEKLQLVKLDKNKITFEVLKEK